MKHRSVTRGPLTRTLSLGGERGSPLPLRERPARVVSGRVRGRVDSVVAPLRLAGPVLALLLLGALCGCKSIRSVRLTPGEPLALTAREAGEARRQGLALYGQQPRSLVRVTNAARLLEQAARALGNEYDPQWQAARTLAFLAENEQIGRASCRERV